MKIVIDNVEYNKIKSINFSPQIDVVGGELPINEFAAEIYTDGKISIGQYARLYDKRNELWAKYWITEAERYSEDTYTIICQSDLLLLERRKLPPVMYENENAKILIESLFVYSHLSVDVATELAAKRVTGFCPEQTVKERLQWICFVCGAYVQSAFTENIKVLLLDNTSELIPPEMTYYRPTINYSDVVTAVEIVVYTYTEGTPRTVDEWVTDGTDYFIQTKRTARLNNSNVSPITPENIVSIDSLTLINENNIGDILTRIAQYYFARVEVSAEIINNSKYLVGKRYSVDSGMGTLVSGFANEMNFSFGNNHKSSVVLKQADEQQTVKLVIIYKTNSQEIMRKTYNLPSGYQFSFENPYIDMMIGDVRNIYYPLQYYTTGTVGENETTVYALYEIAATYEHWELWVWSVDSVTQNEQSGEVSIG